MDIHELNVVAQLRIKHCEIIRVIGPHVYVTVAPYMCVCV